MKKLFLLLLLFHISFGSISQTIGINTDLISLFFNIPNLSFYKFNFDKKHKIHLVSSISYHRGSRMLPDILYQEDYPHELVAYKGPSVKIAGLYSLKSKQYVREFKSFYMSAHSQLKYLHYKNEKFEKGRPDFGRDPYFYSIRNERAFCINPGASVGWLIGSYHFLVDFNVGLQINVRIREVEYIENYTIHGPVIRNGFIGKQNITDALPMIQGGIKMGYYK